MRVVAIRTRTLRARRRCANGAVSGVRTWKTIKINNEKRENKSRRYCRSSKRKTFFKRTSRSPAFAVSDGRPDLTCGLRETRQFFFDFRNKKKKKTPVISEGVTAPLEENRINFLKSYSRLKNVETVVRPKRYVFVIMEKIKPTVVPFGTFYSFHFIMGSITLKPIKGEFLCSLLKRVFARAPVR